MIGLLIGAVAVVVLGWVGRQVTGELKLRRPYDQPAEPKSTEALGQGQGQGQSHQPAPERP